ncbi:MAG: hypothetical protein ACFFBD_08275 [Candidatus Hodarchaeota archaeon]
MVFKKRTIKRFAEEISQRANSIFIFGHNQYSEAFVSHLIETGAAEKVAIISTKRLLWIEEAKENNISTLIEEREEEYRKETLYRLIGFDSAEKVFILFETPKMIEYVLSGVRSQTKTADIFILSRFAPPFMIYLSRTREEKIYIIDDVEAIARVLLDELELELTSAPVVEIPVPKSMVGKTASEISLTDSDILKIIRDNTLLSPKNALREGDYLLIFLKEKDSLKSLIHDFS